MLFPGNSGSHGHYVMHYFAQRAMRRLTVHLTMIVLSVSAVAAETDGVRQTVDQYLDARESHDPNLAGSLVAHESLERFEWFRQQALHADRKALCAMSLSEASRVLVIRAKYRQFLADIDARTLAGFGMVDQPYAQSLSRDFDIENVTNNSATAVLAGSSYGGGTRIDLVRERDKWRILLSLDGGGAAAYEPIWQQAKSEKGCDAALGMALDLIDRRSKTHLLDPVR